MVIADLAALAESNRRFPLIYADPPWSRPGAKIADRSGLVPRLPRPSVGVTVLSHGSIDAYWA